MSWTKEHETAARSEGWGIETVIDNGTVKPYLMIVTRGPFKSNEKAAEFVLRHAKNNSAMHRLALRVVVQSRIATTKRKSSK